MVHIQWCVEAQKRGGRGICNPCDSNVARKLDKARPQLPCTSQQLSQDLIWIVTVSEKWWRKIWMLDRDEGTMIRDEDSEWVM
ncbi:hypothetical protein N7539_006379 [Penicillium diatomitis]|uniref:Uncharacterized protein n=1 Tax=Penicillium diatomitis TaxID=2819901 RepID=A0A9X0BST4_9EURO|nr:uncharacterized protein N7539_006379 [Penicillium diatomitis]KAJ5482933.1 hypothetical protein N7539_006379 [Penicillium diatomitis]